MKGVISGLHKLQREVRIYPKRFGIYAGEQLPLRKKYRVLNRPGSFTIIRGNLLFRTELNFFAVEYHICSSYGAHLAAH